MMKKNYLFFALSFILTSSFAVSPNYKWGYGFGGKNADKMKDFEVDSKGNVIGVGTFYYTIDMDPSGGVDTLSSVATSPTSTTKSQDIFVTKYNSSGKLVWAYSLGNKRTDDIMQVKVDKYDNIYILGTFYDSIDFDPRTNIEQITSIGAGANTYFAKYDKDFNFIWGKNFGYASNLNYSVTPISFDLDNDANLYITGTFQYTVDFNASPLKINNLTAKPYSTGTSSSTEIFITKYTTDGDFVWANQIPAPKISATSFGTSSLKKIVVDKKNNNFYLGGYYYGIYDLDMSSNFDTLTSNRTKGSYYDVYLAKYDTSGAYIWGKSIGGPNYEYLYSLDVDNGGNLYLVGTFTEKTDFNLGVGIDTLVSTKTTTGTSFSTDVFFAKYDGNANYQWAKKIGSPSTDYINSVSVSNDGNVYIAGYFIGKRIDFNPSELPQDTAYLSSKGLSTSYYDAYIASYATQNGNYNWATALGGTGSEYGNTVKAGKEKDVYLAGYFSSKRLYLDPNNIDTAAVYVKPSNNLTSQDYFLAKYNTCPVNGKVTVTGYNLNSEEVSFGATYQWVNCDTHKPIIGATNQFYNAKSNGNYAVVVSLNGCSDTSSCANITGIGFDDLSLSNQINVFPNPSKEFITVSVISYSNNNEPVKIILVDVLGNEVLQINNSPIKEGFFKNVDISGLSNGIYFLKVNNVVKQIVKY